MPTNRSTASDATAFIAADDSYTDRFGTSMTLNKITETLDSQNRVTGTSTVSVPNIKADIQWVTKKDLLHLNVGEVQIGDGMLFPKVNYGISLQDEVVFSSSTWKIISQIEGEQIDGTVVEEGYIIRKND